MGVYLVFRRKIVEGWPSFHWPQGHTQLKFLLRSYRSFLSLLNFLAYRHNAVSNQHLGPLSDLGSDSQAIVEAQGEGQLKSKSQLLEEFLGDQ